MEGGGLDQQLMLTDLLIKCTRLSIRSDAGKRFPTGYRDFKNCPATGSKVIGLSESHVCALSIMSH